MHAAVGLSCGSVCFFVLHFSHFFRAGRRAAFSEFHGPGFAPGNRNHRLCGQASANFAAGRAAFFLLSGPRVALANRIHWLCGQAGANRAAGRAGHKYEGSLRPAQAPHILKIQLNPLLHYMLLDFRVAADTHLMVAARKPLSSSTSHPSIVVPAGEVTMSFS